MTDKEKKILPFMILGFVGVLSGVVYWLFFSTYSPLYTPSTPATQQPVIATPEQISAVSLSDLSGTQEQHRPAPLNATLGGGSVLSEIQDFHQYEYTDSNGNIVQEILEPEPITVDASNHLLISDDNKRIMNLLRDNLLLDVQAKNDKLRAEKKINKMNLTGEVVPTNVNGGYVDLKPVSNSKFTEIETTQPLLSSVSVNDSEIEEQFSRIEIASITVTERKNENDHVSAWVRIDHKLVKAIEGYKVGDFIFGEVTPSTVSIRYVPANITKKLGHSGFEG